MTLVGFFLVWDGPDEAIPHNNKKRTKMLLRPFYAVNDRVERAILRRFEALGL